MGPLTALGIGAAAFLGYELVLKPKTPAKPAARVLPAKAPPLAFGGSPGVQTGAPLAGSLIGLGTTLISSGTTIARDVYNSPSSSPADYSYGYQVPNAPSPDPSFVAAGDGTFVDPATGAIYDGSGAILEI